MTLSAEQVVNTDLERICSRLEPEFATLQGKRLFISGGAGFLGHYLVQAVLHWNRSRGASAIRLTVGDNYIRGVPAWLTTLSSDPSLTLLNHDITTPLPDKAGRFDFVVHAASIASPTYYRKYPIETMDANVQGLRLLLDRWSKLQRGGVVGQHRDDDDSQHAEQEDDEVWPLRAKQRRHDRGASWR